MKVWQFLSICATWKIACWLWDACEMDRALRMKIALTSLELGSLADAHAFMDGRITMSEFDERCEERAEAFREASQ